MMIFNGKLILVNMMMLYLYLTMILKKINGKVSNKTDGEFNSVKKKGK